MLERMRKGLKYILAVIMLVICTTAVQAQEGKEERDPFYPSADRPITTAPARSNDAPWGRDPFDNPLAGKSLEQKGPTAPGVRTLTGIIYGKDVRLAIYNGETYHEGSTVGDRKLVAIRSRSVVLLSAAGEREEVFLEDFSMSK
jgi:hypothetical protein